MGRYVSGDFEYKFILGNQSSSFGEVLESISKETSSFFLEREIGDNGEIVRIDIDDSEGFIESLDEYTRDYEPITDIEWDMWSNLKLKLSQDRCDKFMIVELKKQYLSNKSPSYLEVDVEY